MKKIFLMLVIVFFPFIVYAETCDNGKVNIKTISLKRKSENVVEIKEATINNKSINVDAKMSTVGDELIYKVLIENNSEEDYELDENSIRIGSDYLEYSLLTEDNIIKKNSSKEVELRITYKTEVDSSQFENGRYVDNQSLRISLSNGDESINNPITKNNRILVIGIVSLILTLTIIQVVTKKGKVTYLWLILPVTILLIPLTINALCKISVEVNSKIEIVKEGYNGIVYRNSETVIEIGETCLETSNGCLLKGELVGEDSSTLGNFYLKHEIDNGKVINSYACVKENEREYCIKGGNPDNYEPNKEILISAFGESSCSEQTSESRFICLGISHQAGQDGSAKTGNYCGGCYVTATGDSYCHLEYVC